MTPYFKTQGRELLTNGYLIVPIKPGMKSPAINGWQTSRIGVSELAKHPNHGVGVLCGQGANPICAIDIDTTNKELADRFVAWCLDNLGVTCERVGKAPKILLVYRAEREGWGKGFSHGYATEWVQGPDGIWYAEGWKETVRHGKKAYVSTGQMHRVEVLGDGQQFVAYAIHPDTGKPYEWVDMFGGIRVISAADLPRLNEEQVHLALSEFNRMAEETGVLQRKPGASERLPTPRAPSERTPAAEDDFFGRVNEAAMADLPAWVPNLFPAARDYNEGYRVTSVDLGRTLEEDLSIVPDGIVDFGVADMGDPRGGKRTPIDLVIEWGAQFLDDPFVATTPRDAAEWLCGCLDQPRESFGWGMRGRKEIAADIQATVAQREGTLSLIAACLSDVELLDKRTEVGKSVGDALRNTALAPLVLRAVQARYKELTGSGITPVEIRKNLVEAAPPTVRAHRPLTEFGNAERMLDKYGKGLMYVPELATWYCWTGIYWRKANDVEIEFYAKETVKALPQEINDHPDSAEFFKFAAASQQAKMVRNMVTLAASDPRVMVPFVELDKHSHYLGAANGVVDLRTGKLIEPDPDLHITKCAGGEYQDGAKAPLFRQTVLDVFNGDEKQAAFFQRLIGYAATGNPVQQLMVIPFGNGANGKSTVLGAVRKAFGSYAKMADPSTFVSDSRNGGNAGAAREDLIRLMGLRFVYVSEPDENGELREGSIKSMTGDEEMTARGPYAKASVDFPATFTVFMPTNHKPIVKGNDDGIWRRLVLLPFTRNFEKDANVVRDVHRAEKLAAELDGVLAWIIEGALAYQAGGLALPEEVKAARNDYRSQMDLLAEWVEECCEVGEMFESSPTSLWRSWEEYAKNRGLLRYVPTIVALGRKMDQQFPAGKDRRGQRVRKGLRVRSDFDDDIA